MLFKIERKILKQLSNFEFKTLSCDIKGEHIIIAILL